jgi:hypothetical protein
LPRSCSIGRAVADQLHPVGFARGTANVVQIVGKVDHNIATNARATVGVEVTALTNRTDAIWGDG